MAELAEVSGDPAEMIESEVDDGAESGEVEFDTDDEMDKRQYGIYQALPVDDAEPNWAAGEAATVEEYLRRVRYEAKGLPSVVTSELDPRRFDTRRTGAYAGLEAQREAEGECPEELKVSLEWLRQFLAGFTTLRQRLLREHEMLTGQVRGLPLRIASPAPAPGPPPPVSPSACMPELAALRGMDQVAVVGRLLSAARAVTAGATLAPGDAARLYALSARLERPLHADTAAAYRALLRRCKEWRSGATGPADPLLPHLSVLIAIAGAYFRQDEELAAMWDREEEEYDDESEFAVS